MWNPDPNTLRLGIILSLNAQVTQREATMVRKALSTIRMAVSDINEGQIIPGLNMSIIIRDSQDPSLYTSTGGSAAIAGAVKLISAKVGGVIGDIRSDLTKYEALMTSSVQIPQCSFASASATLSDQDTYPFFYRTIPTIIVMLDALLDVVRSMGWRRISLIYDINTLGWSGREYFSSRAQKLGIYILAYQPLTTAGVPFDPTYAFVKDRIRSSESRIQVLIATGQNQYELLHEMKEAGFFSPDYAWVTANDISSQLRLDPDVQAYDGLIMVDNGWELSGYAPYEEFLSKWLRLNPIEYPGAGDANLENNEGMAYSCVMMLAYAYRDLIEQAIPDPAMRTRQTPLIRDIIAGDHAADVKVSKFYAQKAYRGPSGPITLDQNGDRKEGNVFFFTIIIVISLFFPIEIYLATFYISIVGIFFVALLALTVLFLPKFWSIWKNFRKPWVKDSHPSNQNQQRLSAGIGRLGSGSGGGVGTLGRMPGDFRTATSNVRRQAGAGAGATAAAAATTAAGVGMGVDNSSFPITAESVLAPVTHPVTFIGGGGSNEKPAKHKRTFSVASLTLGAQNTQLDGNPLGAWMNSRVPHRGSEAAAAEEKSGTFMKLTQGTAGSEEEGSSNSHGDKEAIAAASETMSEKGEGGDATGTEKAQRPRSRTSRGSIKVDIPNEHYAQRTNNNRVEFAESSFGPTGGGAREGGVGREETDVSLDEPMRTTILAERTFGSSTSGAQRMFLLPIRVLRSRITSLLSHWCMATLILIPEAHAFLAVDSTDGRSTSYLMLSMTQVHNEEEPTIRVTACHAGTLLIRFSSQSRLDGWMSLFTEQDLQSLAARSNSTSSSGYYPPYTTGYNGHLPGGNGGGNVSRARRRSVAPEPGPDFINPRNFQFVAPSLGDSDAGGEGGDRGNVLLASDDESQRRSSWASRFGIGFSRFWHRKDSSKSTSGTSSQTAYDVYNSDNNVYHSGYHNDHNGGGGGGGGGGGDEDGFATSRWSRAGGEWTSTDSNMSNSTPAGRQSKRPMKYQPAFGGASEVVVEDLEGEAQSPERAVQVVAATATTNATPQIETMPLKDQSLTNGIEALSSAGSRNSSDVATGYGGVIHATSQRNGSIASGRFGETLPSPMPAVNPPSLPPSMHTPSVRSHRGSVRSVARSDAPPTEDDDEDSDDLYDPEFGIGGNGRRRRNRPKLPSHLLTTQANPAVIPSAAVISAAAAAVSAGWSESDALAAAMASPGLAPITPGRSGGLTPTTPGISPNNSPRYNRAQHDSRASMTSSLRASQYIRQGSVGEEHLSSGSGNSGHSNQGTLATVSASSIIANAGTAGNGGGDGGNGHTRRVFNDRVNNMSPVSNNQTKLFSASSQMLLSSQTTTPSSPITSTPASRVSSVSSVIAPWATYPTSADINNNCLIESQDQPQQQQSQSPQPQL
ncbi:hypothetical protein BGX24_005990 [Mortierella sp. AD032]|nr:hypothetical protein BGX24_005990 [Mortierella sp. AD032]